ncbi:hypothetical protein SVAN01_01384 [Stagonosporopsis vannaccii]|nr:hypothetical protein SVAN01_01384 [Stagonosporopsis vannaccii]
MFFNTRHIAFAFMASTLVNALPFEISQPRDIIARAKSYSVINVDGGASTQAPADATTSVDQKTTTVVGPTVTATVVQPVPVPAAPSTSTSCTSSSASQPTSSTPTPISSSTRTTQTASSTTQAPKPVFVTVTVTQDDGPTEYYDNGMWHTSYRVKTWESVATSSEIASSSTGVPAW